ncbi:MAG: redoxin domain-containing protein [Polyangia bacterium]|jgi:peroxiredoxin
MGISRQSVVAAVLLASLVAGCAGQESAKRGQVDDVPLLTSEGKQVPLREIWREHLATVLIFWSAKCPCVRRYQERVEALLEQYQGKGVTVLGVSSNADETFAEVQHAASGRGIRLPIVRDEDGSLAQALGVRSTPTVVLLDERGRARFVGWLDNERTPGEPDREPWLELALQGVLENRSGFATRTPVFGCTIARRLFGATQDHSCVAPNEPTKRSPQ